MSLLASATAALILVASPVATHQPDSVLTKHEPNSLTTKTQPDSVWLAAHGGFLLGNAHRCGMDSERVLRAGQLIQDLITATSSDTREQENANTRFSAFFVATAFPGKEDAKLVPQCKAVLSEFQRLEQHVVAAKDSATTTDATPAPHFRLSDGE
jgi:hypothetical protein